MTRSAWPVVAVVAAVGLLDIASGAFLLLADTPWDAHGPGTLWLGTPELLGAHPESAALIESLYRRMGAFQLNAGAFVLVIAVIGRSHPRLLAVFMLLAMVTGLGFNHVDRTFFAGTPYLTSKLAIGTAWALAFGWHVFSIRARAPAGDVST